MSRITRIYYYSVLGAIGGLLGWQFSNLLGLSFTGSIYLSELVVGALIGLSVGACIGLAEGINSRNLVQTLKSAGISGLLGLAGGIVGLPLAEGLFQLAGGWWWARPFGWALFGLLTGVAAGFSGGSQMWKGGLGGLLGGFFGGLFLEAARGLLEDTLLGKAAGLILLGAAVGAFIALIVFVLSRVWLEVSSGKMKGSEFILDKFLKQNGPTAIIGSSPLKSEIVLPDPDVSPQHAILQGGGTYFVLRDMSMSGTYINEKKIQQARLSDRQKIRVGNTELVYHEKR